MLALATPLLSLALGAALPAAHNTDWIPASVDANCDVTDIDFSDRLHGFATCAFSDAMTSDDGGLSWHVFGTGLQQSLLFAHASSTDELYAARLGFYHSADRGQHWEELGGLSNNFGSVFDVYFGDAGHLVAIQGGTLLSSDDGGVQWDPHWPETQDFYFDELHFPSASVGYASGGISSEGGSLGSIVRTGDAGDELDTAHVHARRDRRSRFLRRRSRRRRDAARRALVDGRRRRQLAADRRDAGRRVSCSTSSIATTRTGTPCRCRAVSTRRAMPASTGKPATATRMQMRLPRSHYAAGPRSRAATAASCCARTASSRAASSDALRARRRRRARLRRSLLALR